MMTRISCSNQILLQVTSASSKPRLAKEPLRSWRRFCLFLCKFPFILGVFICCVNVLKFGEKMSTVYPLTAIIFRGGKPGWYLYFYLRVYGALWIYKVMHLVDDWKPADLIFSDFSKAFDTVSQRMLPDKMSSTQLGKNIIFKQLACGSGTKHEWGYTRLVTSYSRVPQGSILGPGSFKHLHKWPGCRTWRDTKFDDDSELGGAVYSLKNGEALQRNLDKLEGWEIINCMTFKKDKCHILHLG